MDAPWVALKTGVRLLGDASIRTIQPLRPLSYLTDNFAPTLRHFEWLAAIDGRDLRPPPVLERSIRIRNCRRSESRAPDHR